ncbi:MAG: hypothetical protein ACQERG_02350 [Pseudomonadota bacterium]
MATRLQDLPALRTIETKVSGERYNRVRLALVRLGEPLLLDLPGLRSLAMHLEAGSWVCVDRALDDLPVLAWTDFQHADSVDPAAVIPCRLNFFHAHAGMVMSSALDKMDFELARRLRSEERGGVVPFRRREGDA